MNDEENNGLDLTDGASEALITNDEVENSNIDTSEDVANSANEVQDNVEKHEGFENEDDSSDNGSQKGPEEPNGQANETVKTYTQDEVNQIISARVSREKAKLEREEAQKRLKYNQLESIMKTALNAKDIDDVITKSRDFYREQGISIPDVINRPALNERDEIVLAQADAKEIVLAGKEEMEAEANRIASIPEHDRSLRDRTIFNELCQKLISIEDEENLRLKGYDSKVLEDKEFTEFRKQFNLNTPVSKVYEMYQTVKGTKPVQPKSPGSAKTTSTNHEIKDYYSPEEVSKFSEEELARNPKLMLAVEKSMQAWNKN